MSRRRGSNFGSKAEKNKIREEACTDERNERNERNANAKEKAEAEKQAEA
jgi:hypothetical protein